MRIIGIILVTVVLSTLFYFSETGTLIPTQSSIPAVVNDNAFKDLKIN